jgi:hypothetical protein
VQDSLTVWPVIKLISSYTYLVLALSQVCLRCIFRLSSYFNIAMNFTLLNTARHLLCHGLVVVDDFGIEVELSGIGQVGFQIYKHILARVFKDFSVLPILKLSATPFASRQLFRWAFITAINFLSHFNSRIIYIGLANPASYFPLARQSHQVIYDIIPYELISERRTLLFYAPIIPFRIVKLLASYINATIRLLVMTRTKSTVYSISSDSCSKIDSFIKPARTTICLAHILKDFVQAFISNHSLPSVTPGVEIIISQCSMFKSSILIHSTGEPRKGFHELLPIIYSLNSSLIVIYGRSWNGVGLQIITKLLDSNMIHISNKIIVLNSPSDDDVAALMLNFQMFYFPSRFEGWGLAPSIYLALTNKKPYVSATRVNLEVLGDSAFMIDNWADLVPLLA